MQEDIIPRLLHNDPTLTTLHLHGDKIGDAEARAVAQALKINKTLTFLTLAWNNVEETGARAIAEALKINSTLTSLYFYECRIGDAGAQVIAEALKINKTLTSLALNCNEIGYVGTQAIAETLKINKLLTSLNLYDSGIGEAGAQTIAEALKINQTLTSLNLGSSRIGEAGAQAIAEALKINQTLTSLDLGFNRIGEAGAQAIVRSLKINRALTSLDLIGNRIGTAEEQAIAEILRTENGMLIEFKPDIAEIQELLERNKQAHAKARLAVLELLKIGKFRIPKRINSDMIDDTLSNIPKGTPYEFIRQAAILLWKSRGDIEAWNNLSIDRTKRQKTMESCISCKSEQVRFCEANAHQNVFCGHYCQWMHHVGSKLNLPDLREMQDIIRRLGENDSTMTSLDLYDNRIREAGAQAIAEVLKINNTLTSLSLYANEIRDGGAQAIAEAIKINNTLTSLNLNFNGIGEAGAQAIAEALKINQTLTSLDLGFNRIGEAGGQAIAEAIKTENGMLIEFEPNITEIEELLERNKQAHEKARLAVLELLKIGKFKIPKKINSALIVETLSNIPKGTPYEFIRQAAILLWKSRGDIEAWNNLLWIGQND